MLQIILLLLKIVGFILLAVFGLLLFLILIVLFVPVRYRVKAEYHEEPNVEGRAGWLFHILYAGITFRDKILHIRLRVFGFIVYDNLRTRKRQPKREARQAEEIPRRTAEKPSRTAEKPGRTAEIPGGTAKIPGETAKIPGGTAEIPDELESDGTGQRKEGFFGKLRRRIHEKYIGILHFLNSIKEKIRRKISDLLNIKHKIRLLRDFISDELNQEAFHLTYGSIKRLLKHILPTKLRADIIFGTGDPCSTGKALGAAAALYGFYGEHVKITPDFNNSVFEGNLYVRGRIRLITILIIVIKLLLDKKFKRLIRNVKILKEALS